MKRDPALVAKYLAIVRAARTQGFCEVPDPAFTYLSGLTDSWFGVFAGNHRQRLKLDECDQLIREVEFQLSLLIAEALTP